MKNKGNKLIAEFMGAKPNRGGEYEMYGIIDCIEDTLEAKHFFFSDEMLFDESWDWLMPVVEKMDSILLDDNFVSIMFNRCLIESFTDGVTFEGLGETRLEATYKAVCEFIEWYNKNKTNE